MFLDTKIIIMSDALKPIGGSVRRVLNQAMILEKKSLLKHGQLRLYPSEIHLMQVIREEANLSAGDMARKLGISNGAVSQTLARLENKRVIQKTKEPALKNRVTAVLTDTGKTALQHFESRQEAALKQFSAYLAGLSERDRKTVDRFLARLEGFLNELM
jgi:DNA-binding MarR family transcriptional regulator